MHNPSDFYHDPTDYAPRQAGAKGLRMVLGLAGLGCATMLLCGGVAAWSISVGVRQAREQAQKESHLDAESRAAKQQELRAAFAATSAGGDAGELRQIDALFGRIAQAVEENDDEKFRDEVAVRRLAREIASFSKAGSMLRLMEPQFASHIRDMLWAPWQVSRHKIVSVRPLADPHEAIVYGYFWDHSGDPAEMRWWIVRQPNGQWKAYDWELLQVGLRETLERAQLIDAPSLEEARFRRVFADLEKADEARWPPDNPSFQALMNRAQGTADKLGGEMRNVAQVHIALRWHWHGRGREADAAALRTPYPDAAPGAYRVMMLHALDEERFEEALSWCDKFEEAIGRSPNALQVRGAALEGLNRPEEAAPVWKDLLALDPRNAAAVEAVAKRLGRASRQTIAAWVKDLPEASLSAIAESLADNVRPVALEEFARQMRVRDPESVESLLYLAQAKQLQVDDEAAAELAHQALAKAEDSRLRDNALRLYLQSMQSLGRMIDAYRAAPDATEAFRWLSGVDPGSLSDLDEQPLEALVAAHAERAPEDPWLFLRRGELQRSRGMLEEAIASYDQGLRLVQQAAADEDDPEGIEDALRSDRLAALVEAGKWRLAYAEARREDAAGDDLWHEVADALWHDEQFAALAELAQTHRQNHPDDAWGCYYAGVAAARQDRREEAEALFVEAQEKLPANYFASVVRYQRLLNLQQAGRWQEALEKIRGDDDELPSPDLLNDLARILFNGQQWDELAALLERAAALDWESSAVELATAKIKLWQAKMDFQQRAYDKVAPLALEEGAAWRDALPGYEREELDELRFRSVLRRDGPEAALALGKSDAEALESGSAQRRMIAHLAAGNIADAAAMLEKNEIAAHWLSGLVRDEDVGPIVRGDRLRELRNRYPILLDIGPPAQFAALLREGAFPDDEQIQEAVSAALGAEARVEPPPSWSLANGEAPLTRRKVACGDTLLFVAWAPGPYAPPLAAIEHRGADSALRDALDRHSAWLSVSVWRSSPDGRSDPRATLQAVAARLPRGDWLAVYEANEGRLVEPAAFAEGAADAPAKDGATIEPLWLSRDPSEQGPSPSVADYIRRTAWKPRDALQRSDDPAQVEALVDLGAEDCPDLQWVALSEVEATRYGGASGVAVLRSDAWLHDWLQAGDRARITWDRVADWRILSGETAQQGSDEARRRLGR